MTAPVRRSPSGLGRGLAALIPQRPSPGSTEIPIGRVRRNPYQPRDEAQDAALETLARSIAEHGVLQPILVTETEDGYQLIAGERRLRAAEMAGLDRVPAVVKATVADHDQLELALIENLQREDLNPLEEARAFRRLIDEFGLTQSQVATRVARARSSVANTLRLLDLGAPAQAALAAGRLSEGHARALAGVTDAATQDALLERILTDGLTVRQAEALAAETRGRAQVGGDADGAARLTTGDPGTTGAPAGGAGRVDAAAAGPMAAAGPAPSDASVDPIERERLEAELRLALGTKVSISPTRQGGRIVVEYYDAADLERLFERLTGRPA